MKFPEWVDVVKTASSKELAPYDQDWYYTRCASLARHIYIRAPVGVSTVCKIYGGEIYLVISFCIHRDLFFFLRSPAETLHFSSKQIPKIVDNSIFVSQINIHNIIYQPPTPFDKTKSLYLLWTNGMSKHNIFVWPLL